MAVILSAQCTDKMVNQVTATLFQKYRTLEDYATADPADFEEDIRPTGFFRNKTKHILAAAQKVLVDYGGRSPAPCVLLNPARRGAQDATSSWERYPMQYAEDPDAGIAVDTHVHRLSNRLGLASTKDPEKTEQALMAVVPRHDWFQVSYLLIEHGRATCTAKKPRCGECRLADICPSAGVAGRL